MSKTKHLLVENKFKKLKTFDSIYFRGKSHFEEDGTQNCLVLLFIINYSLLFNQCIDISKGLLVLVVVIIFIFGNLKGCQMKILQLVLQVIIASIHN